MRIAWACQVNTGSFGERAASGRDTGGAHETAVQGAGELQDVIAPERRRGMEDRTPEGVGAGEGAVEHMGVRVKAEVEALPNY